MSKSRPSILHEIMGHHALFAVIIPLMHAVIGLGCDHVANQMPFLTHKSIWIAYTFLIFFIPLYYYACWGPTVWITCMESIEVNASPDICSQYVNDIENAEANGFGHIHMLSNNGKFTRINYWGSYFLIPVSKICTLEKSLDGGIRLELAEHENGDSSGMFYAPIRGGIKISKTKSKDKTSLLVYEQVGFPILFPFIWGFAKILTRSRLHVVRKHLTSLKRNIETLPLERKTMSIH